MKKSIKALSVIFVMFTLVCIMMFSANAETVTGECGLEGYNLTWTLDSEIGVLSITGTGDMADYSYSASAPWYSNRSLIKEVQIDDGVTSIGKWAFHGCTNLESATIPDSVTSIGYDAFYDCIGLESITIPDSVTSIDSAAFSGCTKLASVTIPNSVTSIGDSAFSDCSSLTSISVDENNLNYSSDDGVLFNKDKTILIQYPVGNSRTEYTIPDSVTSIGSFAFYCCTGLTSITIPDSVTRISDCAFGGCTGLTSVAIPDSVTSIADKAFYYCTGLTNIIIPDSVTSIGSSAFYNTAYYNDESNWENNVLYIGNHLIAAKESITGAYEIKKGTKHIANGAFLYCLDLENITIPDSVMSIGDAALYYCTRLASVAIPDSVRSIGDGAFYNCTGLESITISNPDCVIYDSDDTIYEGAIIYGYDGSTAQAYAEKYGRTFKTLETVIVNDSTKIEANFKGDCFSKDVTMVIDETAVDANYVFGSLFDLFKSYNIYFEADGEKVQPDGYVTIKMPLPDGYNAETTAVYYVAPDGTKEKIDSTYEDGYIVFETNHFSEYVLVDESSIHTHSYSSSVTKDVTCTENGVVTYTCSCGDTYTEIIDALGHIFDDDDENCQLCGFDRTDDCDCNCHKGGIAKFFFNIILFFQKLFRMNGECDYGIAHY